MKKKAYLKPTTDVVMLQQHCQLMAGSTGVTSSSLTDPDDYSGGSANENPFSF